jgi:hypothetical protein
MTIKTLAKGHCKISSYSLVVVLMSIFQVFGTKRLWINPIFGGFSDVPLFLYFSIAFFPFLITDIPSGFSIFKAE